MMRFKPAEFFKLFPVFLWIVIFSLIVTGESASAYHLPVSAKAQTVAAVDPVSMAALYDQRSAQTQKPNESRPEVSTSQTGGKSKDISSTDPFDISGIAGFVKASAPDNAFAVSFAKVCFFLGAFQPRAPPVFIPASL